MRFRTQISNPALLHKIVRSLSALARQCVVRLSPEKVHLIVPGNEGRDGVQVWSQVKVPTLFSGFKIESNSGNEIWLEVNLDSLLKVVKSADSSAGGGTDSSRGNSTTLTEAEVTLRLNKRGSQAVWSFEIRGMSQNGKPMIISHQINVHVLSQRRQDELNEPLCPPPDIHLVLPSLGDLRNIVSRLSHVADDLRISANSEGTMELAVKDKSGRVNLTTTWRELSIPQSSADQDGDGDPPPRDKMFSTLVSIRGLLKFLTSHVISGTTIACICENHCVIAYVYIGEVHEAGGVLTFFIPAKNAGDF